jgi:hypothetical protein
MPQIIVRTLPGERPGAVTLQQHVSGSDLNSDQFAAQLMQRIRTALFDAEDIEESARHAGREHLAHRETLYLD